VHHDADDKKAQSSADELAALRARVAELTQKMDELTAAAAQARADEQALRLNEARFRTLATSAPVGIFETDPAGECIFVNERWSQITGTPCEEGLGSGWTRSIHPEDRERVFSTWLAAAQQGREFSMEYRFCPRQGAVTWVVVSAVGLRDDSGVIVKYIGTVTDINANKLETLLTGISSSHARVAILDITGVSTVDTQVANALIRAAKAVRLLGAQMVLSGIRPEVAQTFISLGVDLQGIITCGTLQAGVAYAIRSSGEGAQQSG
jgi:PAS domain S-box-containing protein